MVFIILLLIAGILFLISKTLLGIYDVLASMYLYKTWEGELSGWELQIKTTKAQGNIIGGQPLVSSIRTLRLNRKNALEAFERAASDRKKRDL